MGLPQVVSQDAWLAARKELLAEEKALTRARDAVNSKRRELPMVEIEKDYVFEGPDGKVSLPDLFEGRRQLIVYHLMWRWDLDAGCPSCSFLVDSIGHLSHLHRADTTLAVVSRGPWPNLERFKTRMGWTVPFYSSFGSDFNYDFHVTLDEAVAPVEYNYRSKEELEQAGQSWATQGEQPGTSVFLREGGRVFHTYSSYARGGDLLLGTFNYLDPPRPPVPRRRGPPPRQVRGGAHAPRGRASEVGAAERAVVFARAGRASRGLTGQAAAAHLGELVARGHLLGEQGGLDTVEETFEPADELGLGHPQLGLARRLLVQWQGDPVQLRGEVGREAAGQLLDGDVEDLTQAGPPGLVERRVPDLLEELADHGADPHDLGRAGDRLGLLLDGRWLLSRGSARDHDDLGNLLGRVFGHGPILPQWAPCPFATPGVTPRRSSAGGEQGS